MTNEELDSLLKFRRENFQVTVTPEKHSFANGMLSLSITSNGYQWISVSLLRSEIPKVIKALKDATRKPLK